MIYQRVKIQRYESPLPSELIDELLSFWEEIFNTPYESFRPILAGEENSHHHDSFFISREGNDLAGTSHLTVCRRLRSLGGLGEVATPSAYRQRGIAAELCRLALEEFQSKGGNAIFLGTSNSAAQRIYHRLGWRKLAGTNVMASISDGRSPEEYLVDYFRPGDNAAPEKVTIEEISASARIPVIPLLVNPHDWQVLDANARLFSTRYELQGGCMSLYPRYQNIARDGSGIGFAATLPDNRIVGLSSARQDETGRAQIDGFAHHNFSDCLKALTETAIHWCMDKAATSCFAAASIEDEEKQSAFEALGFIRREQGKPFEIAGREVTSVILEKEL